MLLKPSPCELILHLQVEDESDCKIHNGHFISPLEEIVPGVLPAESVKAR